MGQGTSTAGFAKYTREDRPMLHRIVHKGRGLYGSGGKSSSGAEICTDRKYAVPVSLLAFVSYLLPIRDKFQKRRIGGLQKEIRNGHAAFRQNKEQRFRGLFAFGFRTNIQFSECAATRNNDIHGQNKP
jgi:hypothetical protein